MLIGPRSTLNLTVNNKKLISLTKIMNFINVKDRNYGRKDRWTKIMDQ